MISRPRGRDDDITGTIRAHSNTVDRRLSTARRSFHVHWSI